MQNVNPETALKSYQQALLINPKDLDAQINCGNLCVELHRYEEAAGYFRRIVRVLKTNQAAKNALCYALQALGNQSHMKGQFAQAEACFQESLNYQTYNAVDWYNLGNAQRELGKPRDALFSYLQSIRYNPNDADTHNNCGNIQRELGQLDKAIASYKKALFLNPNLHHALAHLVHQKQHICDWHNLTTEINQLRGWVKTEPHAQISPFAFLAMPNTSMQEQKQCASNWADNFYAPLLKQRQLHNFNVDNIKQDTKYRLKVGYLSADFRLHPLAFLITELMEQHDRTQFEIFAYSYGVNDKSFERKRLEKAFDHFNDIRLLNDNDAASKIYSDGIDILVDLTGYTQTSRTAIIALKPAPISVNWLGYPGTMGSITSNSITRDSITRCSISVDSMQADSLKSDHEAADCQSSPLFDYIIADALTAHNTIDFSEQIISLPCYQPNNSARPIGKISKKAANQLPENAFVFCCFNQSFKITETIFEAWMRILNATPNSVLWLLNCNRWAIDNLQTNAEQLGINKDRLIFAPRIDITDHLSRHKHADLFLDTLPYNAHTTASDALWMRLPVLTCIDESFASRVAASLLTQLDCLGLITHNLAQYEAKAIELANDLQKFNLIKKHLNSKIEQSDLFKPSRFAKNLEKHYQHIWQTYCNEIDLNLHAGKLTR